MGASASTTSRGPAAATAVLVERETLGSGSTSKAAGGIRAQFSDELNIRIALECIRRYERFAEEPGGEIDFKQWGYLFLLTAEEEVVAVRALASRSSRARRAVACSRPRRGRRDRPGPPTWTTCSPPRSARSTAMRRRRPRSRATRRRRPRSAPASCRAVQPRGSLSTRTRHGVSRRPMARSRPGASSWPPASGRGTSRRRRRGHPGRGREAARLLHRAGRPAAPRAAADDRLRDRLLLPPRGARPPLRRARADARGARARRAARRLPRWRSSRCAAAGGATTR